MPTTSFWKYPSIAGFSGFLLSQLDTSIDQAEEQEIIEKGDWFIIPEKREGASQRLFCFHGAGENAVMYHKWAKYLPAHIELVNVQLPGRGTRLGEDPYNSLDRMLDEFLPEFKAYLDKEFYLFGHSMGCLLYTSDAADD